MPVVTEKIVLDRVEHILGSGTGTLDFAVEGENGYYTWHVVNVDEDRFEIRPETVFTCEIPADGEENNEGPVRCWCE
jgi:hypothetical protein